MSVFALYEACCSACHSCWLLVLSNGVLMLPIETILFLTYHCVIISMGSDKYIFDAHRNVPLGKTVVITDLDSLFGVPILSDTVLQTSNSWALYEQESQAADFLPTETGDTLVMMRRIYGREGDWIVWIDLEILGSDSLRVLNFLAYDNSQIEI